MKKFLKTMIIFIIVLGAGIGCYILLPKSNKKLNYDDEKGAVAAVRVENAQYTPDLDKFIVAQSQSEQKNSSASVRSLSLNQVKKLQSVTISTEEEFAEIIDDYATIENYAGAGKYQGYDIYEIKNEIKYVVENVPAFNQWFRMPTMRGNEGYIRIPYYENWAYYLELNTDTLMLSITRVCWNTRSSYIDFSNNSVVKDHADGTSFVQYEIMKTNYYINSDNKEVVECYIYSVGVDNVKNGVTCNTNNKDYYSFEYQYLKNVKDTSLIKYHITVAKRYASNDPSVNYIDFNNNNSGMDIRNQNPYGVRREFTIVNYDGYQNIDVTQIDQKFATLDDTSANGSVSFDINSENIKMLVKELGINNQEYLACDNSYDLMNKIAMHIIDNFEIKNNWADIYKNSSDAIKIDLIKGPFYGSELPVSYMRTRLSIYSDNMINGDIDATIINPALLQTGAEYSWSLALKSKLKTYIIAADYHVLSNNKTNAYLESDYSWQELSNINIDRNGEYTLTVVLTKKVGGIDEIVLDPDEPMFVIGHNTLKIDDTIDNSGITHQYLCKSKGGKMTVTVTTKNS